MRTRNVAIAAVACLVTLFAAQLFGGASAVFTMGLLILMLMVALAPAMLALMLTSGDRLHRFFMVGITLWAFLQWSPVKDEYTFFVSVALAVVALVALMSGYWEEAKRLAAARVEREARSREEVRCER